jgi:cell division protein FtsZ
VEAAQAAMASPLLDAGAIDGARGILINITGSSSLKLSEVNEASSLIESAAHEDANIIFGAVLDEKMGEEVKITVIATGFRDQMPERRARMLNVEEALVVSVPVVSTGNWMRERSTEPAAAPARFMSEEDDAATENADDGFFFAAAAPGVATTVTVSSPAKQAAGHAMEFATNGESAPSTGQQSEGTASESDKQPRDFAAEFAATPRDGAEPSADTGTSLFAGPAEQPERDLDVPTFLRRLKF